VPSPPEPSPAQFAAIQIAEAIETEGWAVSDSFVSLADSRLLTAQAERQFTAGLFRSADVGPQASHRNDHEVRRDQTLWLDLDAGSVVERRYANSMEMLRTTLNQRLYLGLFDLDVHFARYEAGTFYKTHHDRPHGAAHRTVSCILYLNELWCEQDEGRLRLYLEAPDRAPWIDIDPTAGRLVCFLSDRFHHEVLPVGRTRLALSGWLSRRH
jgi:SM-20-related protein